MEDKGRTQTMRSQDGMNAEVMHPGDSLTEMRVSSAAVDSALSSDACVHSNGCTDDQNDQNDQKSCYPVSRKTKNTCNKHNKPCNTSNSGAHVLCVVLHIDRFPFSAVGSDQELRPVSHPANHCGWIRTKPRYVAKAAGADPILGVEHESLRRGG